jgi:hypothetical protein
MDKARQSREILKEKLDNFQTNSRDLERDFEQCSVNDGSLILRMIKLLEDFNNIIEVQETADKTYMAVFNFTMECISRGELEKEDEICWEVQKTTGIQLQNGKKLIELHKDMVQVRQITDFVIWNMILTASSGLMQ